MRSALLVCDRAALLKHLRQHFAINWHGAHGASHCARVRNAFTKRLAAVRFIFVSSLHKGVTHAVAL